jgi:hypothetical protein
VVAGETQPALVVTPPTVTLMFAVPDDTYCGERAVDDAVRGIEIVTATFAVSNGVTPAAVPPGLDVPPPPQPASSAAHAASTKARIIGPRPASG